MDIDALLTQITNKNLRYFIKEDNEKQKVFPHEKNLKTKHTNIFTQLEIKDNYKSNPKFQKLKSDNFNEMCNYVKFKLEAIPKDTKSSYKDYENLKLEQESLRIQREIEIKKLMQMNSKPKKTYKDMFKTAEKFDFFGENKFTSKKAKNVKFNISNINSSMEKDFEKLPFLIKKGKAETQSSNFFMKKIQPKKLDLKKSRTKVNNSEICSRIYDIKKILKSNSGPVNLVEYLKQKDIKMKLLKRRKESFFVTSLQHLEKKNFSRSFFDYSIPEYFLDNKDLSKIPVNNDKITIDILSSNSRVNEYDKSIISFDSETNINIPNEKVINQKKSKKIILKKKESKKKSRISVNLSNSQSQKAQKMKRLISNNLQANTGNFLKKEIMRSFSYRIIKAANLSLSKNLSITNDKSSKSILKK